MQELLQFHHLKLYYWTLAQVSVIITICTWIFDDSIFHVKRCYIIWQTI